MREGLTRAFWPALIVAAFCLPLFAGLGAADLENDEAIYSYAVETILERGDWLNPLISPEDDTVFLEKPPLKFWMVAAPIHFGWLRYDEFGLRAVDAVLGSVAFLYVLAIGWRLAGPLCGAFAVLVLFVYQPLLFTHGIRSNNMEAPLLLAYCGGVYHWLAWAAADRSVRRSLHVLALGLYFYLGFMTKFVAVLFLPMVLGLATLLHGPSRRRLTSEPRPWLLAIALFVLLAAPWFLYQHYAAGRGFWRVIFAEHVYERFTSGLDPNHLRPWNFYLVEIAETLRRAGVGVLVLAGLALMAGRVAASRWLEGAVVLAWFVIPVAAMSLLTSKIHHYAYPFLPPLALAAGYAVVWLLERLKSPALAATEWLSARTPVLRRTPVVPAVLTATALSAIALAAVTFVAGPVRVPVPGLGLFRNSGIERPLLLAFILLLLAGRPQPAVTSLAILLVLWISPTEAYRGTLAALPRAASPLRATSACLVEVARAESDKGHPVLPILAVNPKQWFLHPHFYYLRRASGWQPVDRVDDRAVAAAIEDTPRPVLIGNEDYTAFEARRGRPGPSPEMVATGEALLILPGPYARCALDHWQASR